MRYKRRTNLSQLHSYGCSYLGFGLMAARAAVLQWADTANANPCVAADGGGLFKYGGKEHKLVSHPDGSTFGTCAKLVNLVMGIGSECGVAKSQLVRESPQRTLISNPAAGYMFREAGCAASPVSCSIRVSFEGWNWGAAPKPHLGWYWGGWRYSA